MQWSELTQTLSFGVPIEKGSDDDLQDGCLEARRIRNETNRLDRDGWDWADIKSAVADNVNHVKNTSQYIVDKTLGEIETYHDNKDDGLGAAVSVQRRPVPDGKEGRAGGIGSWCSDRLSRTRSEFGCSPTRNVGATRDGSARGIKVRCLS